MTTIFPTLDFLVVENRYPKAVKAVTKWLFEQEELEKATKDFVDKKNPDESKRQFTGMLIQMDPRKLYEVFDSFQIYISIRYSERAFWFDLESPTTKSVSATTTSRILAEQTAFYDAFDILEKQLDELPG